MKPLTAGLAAMGIAFVGGYIALGLGVGLLCAAITMVLLPPRFDPAIIWKERQLRQVGEWPPECYGEMPPNYGHRAEHDCPNCQYNVYCDAITKGKPDGPA